MGVAHCPWWVTGRNENGYYSSGERCGLNKDLCGQQPIICEPIYKGAHVGTPLLCPQVNRVKYLIVRSRKGIKHLTEKDKDYLMYAYRKITQTNLSHYESDTYALIQSLQSRCAKIATERCRNDDACPFKALLPEYDIK